MNDTELKNKIMSALKEFHGGTLRDNSIKLLSTLGYTSDKSPDIGDNPEDFIKLLRAQAPKEFDEAQFKQKTLFREWESASLLFQLAGDDITEDPGRSDKGKIDTSNMQSYVFFAVSMSGKDYPRGALAKIARQINRVFPMPVMVLISYENKLTMAIINRRLDKRKHLDRDVLEKVTLIKDIDLRNPHRAHTEILFDLSIDKLRTSKQVATFNDLHAAWTEILNVEALNKKFYKRIQEWFFLASQKVKFPHGGIDDEDVRNRTALIRLLTRIVFCWFAKEKGLIPESLFDPATSAGVLKRFEPLSGSDGSYYKAILQNLFFPTLSIPLDQREFRNGRRYKGVNKHYMRHEFFRHEAMFKDHEDLGRLFSGIPFLNGGLFECLDSGTCKENELRVDGFSDVADNQPLVPNILFFGKDIDADLSSALGSDKKSSVKVDGLFRILEAYKFTISENTPVEEEIALDPELLGRIFENLLAEYNPETMQTARKQTGSFYTPRNIVDYMVDESLIAYLDNALGARASRPAKLPEGALVSGCDLWSAGGTPGDISDGYASAGQDARAPKFLNSREHIDTTRHHLPHWEQNGVAYFVTFRLADSLPKNKLDSWRQEREAFLSKCDDPPTCGQEEEYQERFGSSIDKFLDNGSGSCALRSANIAKIVSDALRHFDGERYSLYSFVVMPNHVHVLFSPLDDESLPDIVHSWKSYTAKLINKELGRTGAFWQEDYWDRIIRSQRHFDFICKYIGENPGKAKLRENEFVLGAPVSGGEVWSAGVPPGDLASSFLSSPGGTPALQTNAHTLQLRKLLSYNELPHGFSKEEVEIIVDSIYDIKVLDPACGSGAFPMGMLHKLVYVLEKLDTGHERWKKRILDETPVEMREETKKLLNRSSADHNWKLGLVLHSIYGVDIQPIAVQIAKLRCFISLLVDFPVDENAENKGVPALPNLDFKFVAANTLIKPPSAIERDDNELGFEDEFFTKFAKAAESYFFVRDPEQKRLMRIEIEKLIDQKIKESEKALASHLGDEHASENIRRVIAERNKQDIERVRREIELWESYRNIFAFRNKHVEFFDTRYFFPEVKDGFDIVIGNPPYVQIQNYSGTRIQKDLEDQEYETFVKTGDIYCLFYERGCQILADGGILSYISSNKWMRANYGKPLRKFFAEKSNPVKIVDFDNYSVFDATVNTNIIIVEKAKNSNSLQAVSIKEDFNKTTDISDYLKTKGVLLKSLSEDSWLISSDEEYALKKRIEEVGVPLKEWDIQIYRGILTGFNEAFIIDGKKKDELIANDPKCAEIIKPILRGRDIKRYRIDNDNLWLIFIPWHFPLNDDTSITGASEKAEKRFIKEYPAIYAHLFSYKDSLISRNVSETGIRYEWYVLQRCAASYYKEFSKQKITWGNPALSSQFALAGPDFIINAPSTMITPANKYLLAVLNSTVGDYYIRSLGVMRSGGYFEYKPMFIERLPVPRLELSLQKPYEILVDCILFAKDKGMEQEAKTLEWVVDTMVYGLYFETEMKEDSCYINDRIAEFIKPFKSDDTDEFKAEYTRTFVEFCRKDDIIYHGLVHSRTVKPVKIINGAKDDRRKT